MPGTKGLRRTLGRTFSRSHPWITFQLDLTAAPFEFWMLLGEARSKCQHIAGVPLKPSVAEKLYEVYLAKGVHATTHIEGNTLSEEQIRKQIKQGNKVGVPKSQEYLFDETQNVIDACNEIAREVISNPRVVITPERICRFNRLVLRGKAGKKDVFPGEVRRCSVGVGTYRGAPWEDCEHLLQRLCDWLNEGLRPAKPEHQFLYAIARAVMAHLYIAWIHPFGDGNGRTARLIEYQILMQSGLVPLPAGHLPSNHYNKTRLRYYEELDQASQNGGNVIPFLLYAVEGFVDGLREQLDYIRDQQWRVAWENYVHEYFGKDDTKVGSRRKHLLLDMPPDAVPRKDLTKISARVARDYAEKGDKTLTRDINELVKDRLLIRRGNGYSVNRDLILAFLPPLVEGPAPAPDGSGGP